MPRSVFRIGFDMAADIDQREDEIAKFIRDLLRLSLRQRFTQFGDFLLDLVENGGWIRPIETDARSLFLQLESLGQSRLATLHTA